MDEFLALLEATRSDLTVDREPGSATTRRALLLACHAAAEVIASEPGSTSTADWVLHLRIVQDVAYQLENDYTADITLNDGLPPVGGDRPALRAAVVEVTKQVAFNCTDDTLSGAASPWQRLEWSTAAIRLDDAARELR